MTCQLLYSNARTGMVSTQVANHRKVKESNTETKEDI